MLQHSVIKRIHIFLPQKLKAGKQCDILANACYPDYIHNSLGDKAISVNEIRLFLVPKIPTSPRD